MRPQYRISTRSELREEIEYLEDENFKLRQDLNRIQGEQQKKRQMSGGHPNAPVVPRVQAKACGCWGICHKAPPHTRVSVLRTRLAPCSHRHGWSPFFAWVQG